MQKQCNPHRALLTNQSVHAAQFLPASSARPSRLRYGPTGRFTSPDITHASAALAGKAIVATAAAIECTSLWAAELASRRRTMRPYQLISTLLNICLLLAAAGLAAGQALVRVDPLVIDAAATTVTPTFTWTVAKSFGAGGGKTNTLSIAVGSSGTANYQVVATKNLQTNAVAVRGSFRVQNVATNGSVSINQPTLAFSTAPAGGVTPSISCDPFPVIPEGGASTCSFTASWTTSSLINAASQTTVTATVVTVPDSTQATNQATFSLTAVTAPNDCVTVSDSFIGGDITENSAGVISASGNRPPAAGIQTCSTTTYQYVVTFANMNPTWCSTPQKAINLASLQDPSGGPQTDSATTTITVTGCEGAQVSVGNLQTTVINTYTWTLDKTGGGSGLTTTPDAELTVPFTITATQALQSTVGYVAGTITVQNSVGSTVSIVGLSVTLSGGSPTSVPVSNCNTPTLTGQGTSASCSFNVTNPAAPAAGTATAIATLAGGTTATSTAAAYDYQSAATFNIGGTANIYDTVNTQGLSTVTSTLTGVNSLVRFEPADQRPPSTTPGLSLSGSRTFTYNMIISRLLQCTNDLSVTNTATLVPSGSNTQLTKSASVTFRVTGCNVLPSVGLTNVQLWSAVTWSWTLQKTASPNNYQLAPGAGGSASYTVTFNRNLQSGNYWLSGNLVIQNPAAFPMYISSVSLVSTSGQFGALPANCLGGSNVGGTNTVGGGGLTGSVSGAFLLAAGAQINCVFNVSAGSGSPFQGTVYAQASISNTFVSASGNTAFSPNVPVDFNNPTQRWDIGGCVLFSDSATTSGAAGAWAPQLTGLPQQQQVCQSNTITYTGAISPVPVTGATCNQPVTITNNAVAVPQGGGGGGNLQSSATIQVMAVGCQSPSPSPTPNPLSPSPSPPPVLQPAIVSVNPGVSAVSAGNYQWAVALSNDADDAITVPYSSTQRVAYTVTATRTDPGGSAAVSGSITVSNPNTAPLSVTGVTAAIGGGGGSATADCSSPYPLTIPSGGVLVCSYKIPVAATVTSGQVTASVASSAGTSTSATPVTFAFDGADAAGAQGRCAVITDAFQQPNPILVGTLTVANNRPASGAPIQVCESTTYTFTAVFGPFQTSDCNVYPVPVTATVTPTNGPQAASPAVAQDVLQMSITQCPGATRSVDKVSTVANPPTATSNAKYEWTASTEALKYNVNLQYTDTAVLKYNVSWDKVPRVTSTLSGTVSISNPTAAPVTISSVNVEPDLTVGAATIPAFTATCPDTTLAAGESTTCSYSTTTSATGSGTLTVEATLGDGSTVTSDAVPFSFQGAAVKAPGADVCAEVLTGVMLGGPLLQPGTAKAVEPSTQRVCEAGYKIVSQPVGPFKDNQCGRYMVMSTTRLRPLSGTQQAFSSLNPVLLQVSGCPLSVVPNPTAAIGPNLSPTLVVSYTWKLAKTSNVTGSKLTVPYNRPTTVAVTASGTRSAGRRSISVQGTVQLQGQGKNPLTVSRVQAAGQTRTGELIIVNATCPQSSISGGLITVPPPPSKLQCQFQIDGLVPMDGAILPLVAVEPGSTTLLPTDPGVYKTAGAPRDTQGDCATFGASASFTKAGSAAVVQGQPARDGAAFPSTPICRTASNSYTLTFGPFKADQCGSYKYESDLSADYVNSPAWQSVPLNFDVEVTGCP